MMEEIIRLTNAAATSKDEQNGEGGGGKRGSRRVWADAGWRGLLAGWLLLVAAGWLLLAGCCS